MNQRDIWQEGFAAGEKEPVAQCPYDKASLEAIIWRRGWIEGSAKRLGYTYRDTAPDELSNGSKH